jgi:hypothetical protein
MAYHNWARATFNIHRMSDLPAQSLPAATHRIKEIAEINNVALHVFAEMQQYVVRELFGAGAPRTPYLKRDWNKKIQAALPERPNWLAIKKQLEALKSDKAIETA